jgi:hypothetical protein
LSSYNAAVASVVLDVSALEGTNAMREPYSKRGEILESVELVGSHRISTPSFSDGEQQVQRARRAARARGRRRESSRGRTRDTNARFRSD